jgi:hypothetical protein
MKRIWWLISFPSISLKYELKILRHSYKILRLVIERFVLEHCIYIFYIMWSKQK